MLRWPAQSTRFRVVGAVLLGLGIAYSVLYLAISFERGWPDGFGDSYALWSWGRFLGEHQAAMIYDREILRTAQLGLGMKPEAAYPFAYPPSFLPVLWVLGQMSGPMATAVLIGLSLPLYLWATLGRYWRSPLLLAAVAAPTTAIGIVAGQSGFLAGGLLAGGLRIAADRPIAAGTLLGLAAYKPQLGLLVPLVLLVVGQWRTMCAAGVTVLLVAIDTEAAFGPAIWQSWAAAVPRFSAEVAAESGQIRHLMPTVEATLLQLGASAGAARLAQWTAAAAVALGVWWIARNAPWRLAAAGVLVGAFLTTPYAFVYDMPIVTTAVLWTAVERYRAAGALGLGEMIALAFALTAPIALVAGASVPVAVPALAALLWVIGRRVSRLRWEPGRDLPSMTGSQRAPAST